MKYESNGYFIHMMTILQGSTITYEGTGFYPQAGINFFWNEFKILVKLRKLKKPESFQFFRLFLLIVYTKRNFTCLFYAITFHRILHAL